MPCLLGVIRRTLKQQLKISEEIISFYLFWFCHLLVYFVVRFLPGQSLCVVIAGLFSVLPRYCLSVLCSSVPFLRQKESNLSVKFDSKFKYLIESILESSVKGVLSCSFMEVTRPLHPFWIAYVKVTGIINELFVHLWKEILVPVYQIWDNREQMVVLCFVSVWARVRQIGSGEVRECSKGLGHGTNKVNVNGRR